MGRDRRFGVAEINFIEAVVEEGSPNSPVVASAEAIELGAGDVLGEVWHWSPPTSLAPSASRAQATREGLRRSIV